MNQTRHSRLLSASLCGIIVLAAETSWAQRETNTVTLINQASRRVSYRIGYPSSVFTTRRLSPGEQQVWSTEGVVVCVVGRAAYSLHPGRIFAFRSLNNGEVRMVRLAQSYSLRAEDGGRSDVIHALELQMEMLQARASELESQLIAARKDTVRLRASTSTEAWTPVKQGDWEAERATRLIDIRSLAAMRPSSEELVVLSWPSGVDTFIRAGNKSNTRRLQYLGRTPLACTVPAGVHLVLLDAPPGPKGQWGAPGSAYYSSSDPADIEALLHLEVKKEPGHPAFVRALWLQEPGTPTERLMRATADSADLFNEEDMGNLRDVVIRGLVTANVEPSARTHQQLASVLGKTGYVRFLLPAMDAAVDFELTGNRFHPGLEKHVKFSFVRGNGNPDVELPTRPTLNGLR